MLPGLLPGSFFRSCLDLHSESDTHMIINVLILLLMANPNLPYSVKSNSGSTSSLGSFLQNSIGSFWNKLTGAGLTTAQQQQQDYQTEMANTAFQRQVADMRQAGLNPALLYGQGAGSGAATPAGPETSGNGDIASVLQLSLLGKQAKLLDAQAEKTSAEAGLVSRETAWKDKISQAQLDEIASRIGVNEADINAREYDNALKAAQEALTRTQNRWFGKTAQSQIDANDAGAARNRAEAAISELEYSLGHRLSSSELLALADSLFSAISGSNPLPSRAAGAVVNTIKRHMTPKGYRTGSSEEISGHGGRAASYPGRYRFGRVPGQRRTRYGSSRAGGR